VFGAAASRTLANGVEIPRLGFGVWQVASGADTERAVGWALEAGYRHLDTAQRYGNEADVGHALAASGLPRGQVFVTTKLHPAADDPVAALEASLERLGLDQVDLYLLHSPQGKPTSAWPAMEEALDRRLARAIGVSNFGIGDLDPLFEVAEHRPVVNQVQLSPFQYRRALVAACERRDIAPAAYSPLTSGEDLGHPLIAEIAARAGRTPAQVMLRWGLERGFIVITKSARCDRIAENRRLFDFALPAEDLAKLDALDRTRGTGRAVERWWQAPRRTARTVARRLRC
jgi:diketogulonate reductase-like aldo/keto reductase